MQHIPANTCRCSCRPLIHNAPCDPRCQGQRHPELPRTDLVGWSVLTSLGCMHDQHHARGGYWKFFFSRKPPCQPSHDLRTQHSQPHRRGAMIRQSPLLRATGTITCSLTRPCCPALAAWILAKTRPQLLCPRACSCMRLTALHQGRVPLQYGARESRAAAILTRSHRLS